VKERLSGLLICLFGLLMIVVTLFLAPGIVTGGHGMKLSLGWFFVPFFILSCLFTFGAVVCIGWIHLDIGSIKLPFGKEDDTKDEPRRQK